MNEYINYDIIQFQYVTKTDASKVLGISEKKFMQIVANAPVDSIQINGRFKRYKFEDLIRLMYPEANMDTVMALRLQFNFLKYTFRNGNIGRDIKQLVGGNEK